jgi:DNA-binding response OmpR family regulator
VHYRNVLFCDETAGDIAGFMKALRRDTKTKNIALPVFLVSAGVQEEQVAIARDAGMNGVVVKPLSVATVEKKLRLTLEEPKAWIATPNFIGPDRRIHREAGCAARWRFFDRRVRSDELVRVFPVPPVLPK